MAQNQQSCYPLRQVYASVIHLELKEERKSCKNYVYLWGRRFSLALPAGTLTMFTKSASMDALYVKGQVRPSVKGKMREFYLEKVTCGYF